MRFLWVLFTAAVAFVGCSEDALPIVGTTLQAIQGGMNDGTAHPYAMGMCVGGKGNCSYLCSAALIAPNLVLTARHCVAQTPSSVDCNTAKFGAQKAATSSFWFTTSPNLFQNSQGWHQAAQIAVPASNDVCGNDIALVILADVVSSNEAKPVTPLVYDSMTNHKKYSTSHTAIGYGNNGGGGSGTRRIKQNMLVACIPGDKVKPCPNWVNPAEFFSDDGVCSGDSGSSAYEQLSFNNNDPVTYGVASRAGFQSGNCVSSIYERTDAHTNLFVNTAITAANMGSYAAPPWTVPPPPPPPDAGADAGVDASKRGDKNLGEACGETNECVDPLVCEGGWNGPICTQPCDADNACPDGLTCQTSANGDLCFPPKPAPPADAAPPPPPPMVMPTSSGCSASGGSPSAATAALLALLLLARSRSRS